ncbi:MAG: YicC/YloC family endoribonuclease [Candidatus Omnitrophota bacterium]
MICSMTGFGKGEERFKSGKVTVEIKTVNHKFFDATLKLPNGISAFEDKIKEILQKKIKRGKVNLNLTYDGVLLKADRISINKKAAKNYHDALEGLKKDLGLREEISMKDIISLPGVLSFDSLEEGLAAFWPRIKKALDMAIDKLIIDREKEGKALYRDLISRTKKIAVMLKVIKSRSHLNIDEYRKRFADRVKDLTGGREIDMGRLEMEVAIFAKNSDISEEVTRLDNHLCNFNKTISVGGEVGKKIDFIAQELHREINTIGSKASDFKISKNVIEIKGEIEKIREQAKNLE